MKKIYAAVSPDVSRREIENRNRSRLIAAEGMVLLENNGILPLKLKGAKSLCLEMVPDILFQVELAQEK